jgi:hypothetical protein
MKNLLIILKAINFPRRPLLHRVIRRIKMGRESLVGIAILYKLDGSGMKLW